MSDSEQGLTLGQALAWLQRLAAEHGQDLELVDADGDLAAGFRVDTADGTVAVVDRHDGERQFRPPLPGKAQPGVRKNVRLDAPDDSHGDDA